jgi:hypothetical protein
MSKKLNRETNKNLTFDRWMKRVETYAGEASGKPLRRFHIYNDVGYRNAYKKGQRAYDVALKACGQ